MSYRLPVNDPLHCTIRFADVVPGAYGPSVKLKITAQGQSETLFLPGPASDALTVLREAGVLASVPDRMPDEGDSKGVELPLAVRDVTLLLEKNEPRGRGKLVVTTNGHGQGPASAAPSAPASGARSATAGHPDASAPPSPPLPALEARRAATVASFRQAIDASVRELLPAFTAAGAAVDGDLIYKLSFSVWKGWTDRGL